MHSKVKRRLVIGATTLAVAAFAGGAYAASQDSVTNTRQAFLDDVASRLHVTPQQLSAALRGAFIDKLNAAVKAGKLTQAQANAIEQRLLQHGGLPPFLGPLGLGEPPGARGLFRLHGVGRGGGVIGSAAGYLGLSDSQLLDQLRSGKSLAQVAQSRGKSVSGLKDAITQAIRSRLDQAVAKGAITKSQEQRILNRLSTGLDRLVNRTAPRLRPGGPPPGPPGVPRAPGAFPGAVVVPPPPPVGA